MGDYGIVHHNHPNLKIKILDTTLYNNSQNDKIKSEYYITLRFVSNYTLS